MPQTPLSFHYCIAYFVNIILCRITVDFHAEAIVQCNASVDSIEYGPTEKLLRYSIRGSVGLVAAVDVVLIGIGL